MNKMYSTIFKHTLLVTTIWNITVKTSLIFSPVNRRITAVISPGFQLLSPASIIINVKYDLRLFKQMLDGVSLDICLRIIVFSTYCDTLKIFKDRKQLVSALLKISSPFLCSFYSLAWDSINQEQTYQERFEQIDFTALLLAKYVLLINFLFSFIYQK